MAMRSLKSKKGAWVRPGRRGKKSFAPGSYGNYVYVRAPPGDYDKTAQQKKIAAAGRKCGVEGKSLKDIQECVRNEF